MNLRVKLIEALLCLVAITAVERVVFDLLGPILPSILVLAVVASLLLVVVRRQ